MAIQRKQTHAHVSLSWKALMICQKSYYMRGLHLNDLQQDHLVMAKRTGKHSYSYLFFPFKADLKTE